MVTKTSRKAPRTPVRKTVAKTAAKASPAAAAASGAKTATKKPAKTLRTRGDKSAAPPRVQSVASRLPPVTAAQTAAAEKKFEQGIVARGEAAPAGKPLPRGATHEIVGTRPDGTPILKRKRFSLR